MYADALGGLLAHELLRLDGATAPSRRVEGWRQRRVIDFMEQHVAEDISLNMLADLVRLNSYPSEVLGGGAWRRANSCRRRSARTGSNSHGHRSRHPRRAFGTVRGRGHRGAVIDILDGGLIAQPGTLRRPPMSGIRLVRGNPDVEQTSPNDRV